MKVFWAVFFLLLFFFFNLSWTKSPKRLTEPNRVVELLWVDLYWNSPKPTKLILISSWSRNQSKWNRCQANWFGDRHRVFWQVKLEEENENGFCFYVYRYIHCTPPYNFPQRNPISGPSQNHYKLSYLATSSLFPHLRPHFFPPPPEHHCPLSHGFQESQGIHNNNDNKLQFYFIF